MSRAQRRTTSRALHERRAGACIPAECAQCERLGRQQIRGARGRAHGQGGLGEVKTFFDVPEIQVDAREGRRSAAHRHTEGEARERSTRRRVLAIDHEGPSLVAPTSWINYPSFLITARSEVRAFCMAHARLSRGSHTAFCMGLFEG